MFLTLFAILLVMWLLGFFAFHVAGRPDSPSVDIRGDFLSGAFLQASQCGLKAVPRLDHRLLRNKASLPRI
jgi:hypothetical protein